MTAPARAYSRLSLVALAAIALLISACNDTTTQVVASPTPPQMIATPNFNSLVFNTSTPQGSADNSTAYIFSSIFYDDAQQITSLGNIVGGTRQDKFYFAAKTPLMAGSYTLTANANCQFCLFIYEDIDGGFAGRIFRSTAGQVRVDAVGTVWGEWQGQISNITFSEVENETGALIPGGRTLLMAAPLAWNTMNTDPDGAGPLICTNLAVTPPWVAIEGLRSDYSASAALTASIGIPALNDGLVILKEGAAGMCAVTADGTCSINLLKDVRDLARPSVFGTERRSFISTTGTLTVSRIGTKAGLNGSYSGITLRETSPAGGILPGGACYTLSDAAFTSAEDW